MSVAHDELLKTALSLPEEERILLVTELLESVKDPMPGLSFDDPNFKAELERRASDPAQGVPWSEVKLMLDEKLRR